jgi:hypothetical protein
MEGSPKLEVASASRLSCCRHSPRRCAAQSTTTAGRQHGCFAEAHTDAMTVPKHLVPCSALCASGIASLCPCSPSCMELYRTYAC